MGGSMAMTLHVGVVMGVHICYNTHIIRICMYTYQFILLYLIIPIQYFWYMTIIGNIIFFSKRKLCLHFKLSLSYMWLLYIIESRILHCLAALWMTVFFLKIYRFVYKYDYKLYDLILTFSSMYVCLLRMARQHWR